MRRMERGGIIVIAEIGLVFQFDETALQDHRESLDRVAEIRGLVVIDQRHFTPQNENDPSAEALVQIPKKKNGPSARALVPGC
jgi:hypothetical protein